LYRAFDPTKLDVKTNYHLLISGIIPRPIAFVTTQDKDGNHNLAPFSFYNGFSANPPIIGFSPALSGHTGGPKDTLLNVRDVPEFTVSMVTSAMTEQMAMTSYAYDRSVDEFTKSGLSKRESQIVKPPHVLESPFIMECKLWDIIELGGLPGSGNLILGEVVMFHVCEDAYSDNRIDPHKLDAVSRLGYSWYSRTNDGLFELKRPVGDGIGFDNLPSFIRESDSLTGSELSRLASCAEIYSVLEVDFDKFNNYDLMQKLKSDLEFNDTDSAWQIIHELEKRRG
jgi:flavin reductase (DIM6/NTAB) family NADH-FMN oxidoreductase RutF|tara:strand:- start:1496 stop:2344 length:849 start_codon:yes stop_codon:yes gene_type:complete